MTSKIKKDELLKIVKSTKDDGYRLAQICAVETDNGLDIIYSFDKQVVLKNLVLPLQKELEVESITSIFSGAFIYENEMHDLFGIKFNNLNLDFEGNFFKVATKTPWKPSYKGNTEKGGDN